MSVWTKAVTISVTMLAAWVVMMVVLLGFGAIHEFINWIVNYVLV